MGSTMVAKSAAAVLLAWAMAAMGADPDPLQDLCVADLSRGLVMNGYPCRKEGEVRAEDFVYRGIRTEPFEASNPYGYGTVFGTVREFPGLNTQGLGIVRYDIAPGGVVPFHNHPRASEVIYVLQGSIYAGFLSSGGFLIANNLTTGDVTVFPRDLIHFQHNFGSQNAVLIAVQNSQNAGFQIPIEAIFGSNVSDPVLAITFFLNPAEIQSVRRAFNNLSTTPALQ